MDDIWEIAKSVGLDTDRLHKDMDQPEIADQLLANFNLARALRIKETPSFIVDTRFLNSTSADIDFAHEIGTRPHDSANTLRMAAIVVPRH